MKKLLKVMAIIIAFIIVLGIIQTLPVFFLKPFGAREIKGRNVNVFYQRGDEKGAKEVFDILEATAGEIRKKLEFNNDKPTDVYVYSNQKSLWIRKYGLVTILGAPYWFVGDNKGDQVVMVSPYASVQGNDHDSILSVAIHELVHTINYQINPKLSYWNDNAMATFLAKQQPYKGFTSYSPIPTIDDMKSENEKRFGDIGGYQYSYTYMEFLSKKFEWSKILELIRGGKTYDEIFQKSEQEIYNEWIVYVKENYS